MGLYLCVFASDADDDELEGVDVGSYDDFHALRTTVAQRLEDGQWGSRFPLLMMHSDSDGEWSPHEAAGLQEELHEIERGFAELPPVAFSTGSWQSAVAKSTGLNPQSLAEGFIDVDGEPLLERLRELAAVAVAQGRPIAFQ